jgi:TPP-dependent pyruvate/acetoin dehydrogenase alpha subunit
MSSQPSSSLESAAASSTEEKFNILDPAMLLRIRERALRLRIAQKKLAQVSASSSQHHGLACIAAAVDLGSGDAIAAQSYSLEAEVARGAGLKRVLAALGKRRRKVAPIEVAATLGLATGLAGGAASRKFATAQRQENLPVVVAFIDGHLDARSDSLLRLSGRRKLPLVIVALNGAFGDEAANDASAYEVHRFPRITVDANDPIAIYRVAHEGVDRARIGYGPTLVDCIEWPFRESEGGLGSVERRIVSGGQALTPRSTIEQRLTAELNANHDKEPDVVLFAPE